MLQNNQGFSIIVSSYSLLTFVFLLLFFICYSSNFYIHLSDCTLSLFFTFFLLSLTLPFLSSFFLPFSLYLLPLTSSVSDCPLFSLSPLLPSALSLSYPCFPLPVSLSYPCFPLPCCTLSLGLS